MNVPSGPVTAWRRWAAAVFLATLAVALLVALYLALRLTGGQTAEIRTPSAPSSEASVREL